MSVPITVRGRYLWRGDERFFVRGVVYQNRNVQDPISDACLPRLKHDLTLFKELGLNTLFVYTIDNSKRHKSAMKLLQDAGIYVFTAVSTQTNVINRSDPYGSYNRTAVMEFFQTVDTMAQYPNTLGLLAGVAVMNSPISENASPIIKAVVRDLKKYMKLQNAARGQRILPIGYAAGSSEQLRTTNLDFLSLGDPASTIDFWTCNCYIWAGNSNLQMSGYEAMINRFRNAAIPIFMSEYGTNSIQPRLFQETAALYSPQMSQVFSGGCAYELWQGRNDHGLVELVDQKQPRGNQQQALARSIKPEKTAKRRRTEMGRVSIFHDFVNYKKNLEGTRDIENNWEGDVMEREAADRGNVDTTQMSWPWEPQFQIPDTVVDWSQLEG